ncbi:flavin reductase family protein [Deinococcus arenicola]|uniref:Flavin reductase family protein n=1 Tax=Deinococcus arenicola TaxID=2994950 RepID=A0ABU4DU02_9DEIO|nr:flavin reductase family protein [Deinococcus sp. ZS9-10]MDV6375853.1 flavin reductase family protein [Deinococcus sp. ZS9-10]
MALPTDFRHFDLTELPNSARYKLLTATVVPRPIAWVCTLGADGTPNLAPYSFFGLMGSDPPIVAFAPGNRGNGTPKDTALNIASGGEFGINLVSAELAQVMSDSATDFPHGVAEAGKLGLELESGVKIAVPRVKASPVTLECVEVQTIQIGNTRIILGEVLGVTLRADAVLDEAQQYVDTAALDLIGRMGGRGGYTRTRDGFEIGRMTYAQWQEREGAED